MTKTPDEKIKDIVEQYPQFWKTPSSFMSFIRGGIRQGCWNKHKVKLLKIKNNREQIPNPNLRGKKPTVWGGRCEICEKLFTEKELQVDHIREEVSSLKSFDDVSKFVEDMLLVTEDDLRIVCKTCHGVVSHQQKLGLTFEQSKADKEAIDLVKNSLDINFLKEHNIKPEGSKEKRRKQIVEFKLSQTKEAIL